MKNVKHFVFGPFMLALLFLGSCQTSQQDKPELSTIDEQINQINKVEVITSKSVMDGFQKIFCSGQQCSLESGPCYAAWVLADGNRLSFPGYFLTVFLEPNKEALFDINEKAGSFLDGLGFSRFNPRNNLGNNKFQDSPDTAVPSYGFEKDDLKCSVRWYDSSRVENGQETDPAYRYEVNCGDLTGGVMEQYSTFLPLLKKEKGLQGQNNSICIWEVRDEQFAKGFFGTFGAGPENSFLENWYGKKEGGVWNFMFLSEQVYPDCGLFAGYPENFYECTSEPESKDNAFAAYENKTIGLRLQYPEACRLDLQEAENGVIFFDDCDLSIQKFTNSFAENYIPLGADFLGEFPIGGQIGKKFFTQHPAIGFEGADQSFLQKIQEEKINFVVYLVETPDKNYFEIRYSFETKEEENTIDNIIASLKFL